MKRTSDTSPTPDSNDPGLRRFLFVAVVVGLGLQIPALFNRAFLGLGPVIMLAPLLGVLVAGRPARQLLGRMLRRPIPWGMLLVGSLLGWFHKSCRAVSGSSPVQ